LTAGQVAALRQLGDAELAFLKMQHPRGGLDRLQVDPGREAFFDEVILDHGDGGVVVLRQNRWLDLRRQVVPLAPQRRPQVVDAPRPTGEEGEGAPGVESGRHEPDGTSTTELQRLLLKTNEDGPRHFTIGHAFRLQDVRVAEVEDQLDERIRCHVLLGMLRRVLPLHDPKTTHVVLKRRVGHVFLVFHLRIRCRVGAAYILIPAVQFVTTGVVGL